MRVIVARAVVSVKVETRLEIAGTADPKAVLTQTSGIGYQLLVAFLTRRSSKKKAT